MVWCWLGRADRLFLAAPVMEKNLVDFLPLRTGPTSRGIRACPHAKREADGTRQTLREPWRRVGIPRICFTSRDDEQVFLVNARGWLRREGSGRGVRVVLHGFRGRGDHCSCLWQADGTDDSTGPRSSRG